MTEVVVMKIVELGNAGELDPERLCLAVIAELDCAPQAGAAAGTPLLRSDEAPAQGRTVITPGWATEADHAGQAGICAVKFAPRGASLQSRGADLPAIGVAQEPRQSGEAHRHSRGLVLGRAQRATWRGGQGRRRLAAPAATTHVQSARGRPCQPARAADKLPACG
jgi:hypothetical protein